MNIQYVMYEGNMRLWIVSQQQYYIHSEVFSCLQFCFADTAKCEILFSLEKQIMLTPATFVYEYTRCYEPRLSSNTKFCFIDTQQEDKI